MLVTKEVLEEIYTPSEDVDRFYEKYPDGVEITSEILLERRVDLSILCKQILLTRNPLIEGMILDSTSCYLCYYYIDKVIQCEWIDAEPILLQNPHKSHLYLIKYKNVFWNDYYNLYCGSMIGKNLYHKILENYSISHDEGLFT